MFDDLVESSPKEVKYASYGVPAVNYCNNLYMCEGLIGSDHPQLHWSHQERTRSSDAAHSGAARCSCILPRGNEVGARHSDEPVCCCWQQPVAAWAMVRGYGCPRR